MKEETGIMRDLFIERLHARMREDEKIFFVTADFGSPRLDALKEEFADRFVNVGIAEQNLINVSTGLALEGFKVYAYAIAPFLTMRACEQIRVNVSLLSQLKPINLNLVGVGAGLSYDVSGPTHHCLEDLSIIRTFPNIILFSPSDWVMAEKFVDYSTAVARPKYLRFDGKPLPRIYSDPDIIDFETGFATLADGEAVCLVSTGIMTHRALAAREILAAEGLHVGVIDLFMLKGLDEARFRDTVGKYRCLVTLEEGFIDKGGLDSLVSSQLDRIDSGIRLRRIGFGDRYSFAIGDREQLHRLAGLDPITIAENIRNVFEGVSG